METKNAQLGKAEELFTEAFNIPRDPRSPEYQRGVMAALIYRFAGIKVSKNNPFKPGTVQFDAFMSGVDEGNIIYKRHIQ